MRRVRMRPDEIGCELYGTFLRKRIEEERLFQCEECVDGKRLCFVALQQLEKDFI